MRIPAGALFLPLLLPLPLLAQETEVLPKPGDAPVVEKIAPVPPPKIPFATPDTVSPDKPQDLSVENIGGGGIAYDSVEGVETYAGAVKITSTSGMVIDAQHAVAKLKEHSYILTGMVKMRVTSGIKTEKNAKGQKEKVHVETNMEMFCDQAVIDTEAKTVTGTGNVSIYREGSLQRGERAVYNYGEKTMDTTGMRSSIDSVLMESDKFTSETDSNGKQIYRGQNAGITTNDVENPNYWIRGKQTTIYPGDKVVFQNMTVYAGDTPVFWLPYLSQPLNKELGYHFIPGARSNWGPFLLNTYGIMLGGERDPKTGEAKDQWLLSQWHFDLRESRGVAAGVDFKDTRMKDNPNLGWLNLYYAPDLDPSIQRSGIPRMPIDNDRYTAQLKYRIPFKLGEDAADWRFDVDVTRLSDEYYLEDFDPKTFRTNPFPDNTIGVSRNDGGSLFSLFARMRVNDFYRSDSRTPEIAFDQAPTPIFGSRILHEGNTSLSFLSESPGDPTLHGIIVPLLTLPAGDPRIPNLLSQLPDYERLLVQQIRNLPPGSPGRALLASQLLDPAFTRFHTYHEFSAPMNVGGWLSLVPEVGVGFSRYWDVSGPESSINRSYLQAGLEASVKYSRDYSDMVIPSLGVDGLLHVVQPYIHWSWLQTDDLDPNFPKIDRFTFSTRPRPLDVDDFTAIDDLRDWNIVRFGVRNRLITHRDGQSYDWLYVDTYMDAFIDDPEGNRSVSNLYNDVRWRPLPWMSVDLETQVPIISDGSGFSEVSPRLRFMPNPNVEFSIGERLLKDHPVLPDSNRIDFRGYVKLNEQWGIGTTQVWELQDNVLELQQYTINRDLGNWVAGIGFTRRDDRVTQEYGVIFSLTLKDFPAVTLPFEIDAQ